MSPKWIHIFSSGDFRQLEPVTGRPLYSPFPTDKKWVNSINCYIELQGMHRFKEDPEWGRILKRIRNDEYTQHDIDEINKCVINGPMKDSRTMPVDVSYCVYVCTKTAVITEYGQRYGGAKVTSWTHSLNCITIFVMILK